VDAIFTASTGKCGRAWTSRRTFSSKNVFYDIPGELSSLYLMLKVVKWLKKCEFDN
jgi:hypothetical protein